MIFRELEIGDRLLTSHRGKPFEKLVQSGIFLQMIEQCLDGDTGTSKAWDTAKDFRVHEDGSGQSGRIHKLNLRSMGRRSSGVETRIAHAKGAKGFQMWEWGESRVCGTRLGVLSCECEIYFMKSGIDRHEVRSESGTVVFLEFGESSE